MDVKFKKTCGVDNLTTFLLADNETGALEEKNKRDNYTQLVGACLVRATVQ